MTLIDQFESVFKSSLKPGYEFEPIKIDRAWFIADGEQADAVQYAEELSERLTHSFGQASIDWVIRSGAESQFAGELVDEINRAKPDIICTWRNLHSKSTQWPYSLGENVEILTQATSVPVLVLPRSAEKTISDWRTKNVLALTNHLEDDGRLVNYAAASTENGGVLHLSHLEDDAVFERYMQVIEKIPGIDSAQARETIQAKLLAQAEDFISACSKELDPLEISVKSIVQLGHTIRDHVRIVEENQIDLLVLNTKDEDQIAMHGNAYPLVVELKETATLLL
jgi:hypothetical protein